MKEGMKKKINWMHIYITILITTLIFSVIVVKYDLALKEANAQYIVSRLASLDYEKTLTEQLVSLEVELSELKQEISNRAPDEILVEDISKYIHANFPIIPKVLYNEIAIQIATISRQENVSPELVMGIVQVESAFNPMAISSKNARGLMQVMPFWAKHFSLNKVCDLHNVDVGVRNGIKVLKIHISEEKGDISEGLYKYVNKDRSYVDRVYNAMGKFVTFRATTKKGEMYDSNNSTAEADSGPA